MPAAIICVCHVHDRLFAVLFDSARSPEPSRAPHGGPGSPASAPRIATIERQPPTAPEPETVIAWHRRGFRLYRETRANKEAAMLTTGQTLVVAWHRIRETGYDHRAFRLQCWIAASLLVVSRFLGPSRNLNYAFSDPIFHREFGPAPIHLALIFALLAGMIYWPTHRFLIWILPTNRRAS